MRTRGTLVVAAVVLIASSVAPRGAWAAGTEPGLTQAQCSLSFMAFFSPGLGAAPTSARFDSRGETGAITCVGTILGHRVTGPGTFGFEGTLRNSSCFLHEGEGTAFLTVPTDAGPLRISGGSFRIAGIGLVGLDHATHDQPVEFDGSYLLIPTQGNCVTAPVSEARVLMNGSLRGASGSPATRCDLDALIVQLNCRTGG